MMKEIIQLRHDLHKHPELSGNEIRTAKQLLEFLSKYNPNKIITHIGGNGIAAVYKGREYGPTLLFRCDMDALPIQETSDLAYKSSTDGVAHLCGHDGHMAMISGLVKKLHDEPLMRGRVILFYQPEEENGKGAKNCVKELIKLGLTPDYAFAIHNMPKYPMGSVILGQYAFSAASKGMTIKLLGKNSHAAYPENGISPTLAIAEIIQSFSDAKEAQSFNDFVLLTIVHIRLGDVAFGTSPGQAEVMVTLRAFNNLAIKTLTEFAESTTKAIAEKYHLKIEIGFSDEFPATECSKEVTEKIKGVAVSQNRNVIILKQPNRWSEDFAHFTANFPSVIFGIGAGADHSDLHTNTYDFPDEILSIGIDFMDAIIREFQKSE